MQYTKSVTEGYSAPEMMERIHRETIIYASWMEACGDVRGLRVLDVGCGAGVSSRMLADRGAKVTGFDNSVEMLKKAKEAEEATPQGIEYFECDASQIPEFDEPFDMVTAVALMHYARTLDELRVFISGISRSVKSGGRLVALNTNANHPVKDYDKWTGSSATWVGVPFENGSEIRISVHKQDGSLATSFSNFYWSEEIYRQVFKEYGFDDIEFVEARMNAQGRKSLKDKGWPVTPEDMEKSMVLMVVMATKR